MPDSLLRFRSVLYRGWFVVFSYSGEKSDVWFDRCLSYIVRNGRILLPFSPVPVNCEGFVFALYAKVGIGPTRFYVSVSRPLSWEPSVTPFEALTGVLSAAVRVFDYQIADHGEFSEYRADFERLLFGPCSVSPDTGRRYFTFHKNMQYDAVDRSRSEFVPSSPE